MAFCKLIQYCSRNHLHLLLCRQFGKCNAGIWRNFVSLCLPDLETRSSLSRSCFYFSKSLTTWKNGNVPFSCLGPLQRRFNSNKLGLQSSRSLLQGDVHLSEQNDREKDVKSHLAEAENISSLDKDLIKQQSETFNDQNQVERFAKNPSNNESLVNCGTLLTEHVTKPSVEKSSPETEECDSSSFQKRVVLTPGW